MPKSYLIGVVIIFAAMTGILYLTKPETKEIKSYTMDTISLTTVDGVKLGADYYPTDSDKGIVLLHSFKKDRGVWGEFARDLQVQGYSVVALDLRGHGDSKINHELTEVDFSNGMRADLATARQYLLDQGKTRHYIIGASIGANIALLDLAGGLMDKPVKIVALSPGLNFHGLKTEEAVKEIKQELSGGRERYGYGKDPLVLMVVAADDTSTSVNDVKKLADTIGARAVELVTYDTGGHGMGLLTTQPDLTKTIINFLSK